MKERAYEIGCKERKVIKSFVKISSSELFLLFEFLSDDVSANQSESFGFSEPQSL